VQFVPAIPAATGRDSEYRVIGHGMIKLDDSLIDVSIIIPLKNEAENIEALSQELRTVLAPQSWSWEVIWIDDGSEDGSLALLEDLSGRDPRQRYLSFEKNAGQSAALWAGFQASRGRVIATIDGDAQNDPADIPGFVEMVLKDEADMVNGYRARRKDTLVRKIASRIGNGFRNLTTGKTVRDVGCSTRAFKRECVANLPLYKGMHRFFPTLVAMQGFRLAEIPANHRPRLKGQTKYSINNRLWVGLWDSFGVMWLQKRGFQYKIVKHSD